MQLAPIVRAEDHLRVIRSLMGESQFTARFSAPTGLVGGFCLALCIWALQRAGYVGSALDREVALTAREFLPVRLVSLSYG